MTKIPVGIIGSGNIGTDLMYKVLRSENMELRLFAGIDPSSEGLVRARNLGVPTSTESVNAILEDEEIKIVFDATGAKPHMKHAPLLRKAGKIAIDLTPAAIGPYVVPSVNMKDHLSEPNVNLISCAAQATIPIIEAINKVTPVLYAEIASGVSSKSIGPGTRQNIDEFTRTTTKAIIEVGGAKQAKTLVSVNPAEPPIMMRNTVYTQVEKGANEEEIKRSVIETVNNVKSYVPGYKLTVEPYLNEDVVTTLVEIEGAGDYLPKYAGNLDIINAAAVSIGESYANKLLVGEVNINNG